MDWPQITYLGLLFLGLGIALSQHGQTKTEVKSFWLALISALMQFAILYYGGFFSGGVCH